MPRHESVVSQMIAAIRHVVEDNGMHLSKRGDDVVVRQQMDKRWVSIRRGGYREVRVPASFFEEEFMAGRHYPLVDAVVAAMFPARQAKKMQAFRTKRRSILTRRRYGC